MIGTSGRPETAGARRRARFLLPGVLLLAWSALQLLALPDALRCDDGPVNTAPPVASIADALLRRGGRRFFTKRLGESRRGLRDEDDERRRLKRVSRRSTGRRMRSSRSRGRGRR
eukprot:TRINITY_DN60950_c0_g1_i1.p2 TRINITY_DN60950_c0_g1~~TRINITY_DN60950_c0_g1_i1.p2  ORF type:complete len:115 (+),score=14.21 TRINITY_DN60950_c0_g1_i1:59-403(+)